MFKLTKKLHKHLVIHIYDLEENLMHVRTAQGIVRPFERVDRLRF